LDLLERRVDLPIVKNQSEGILSGGFSSGISGHSVGPSFSTHWSVWPGAEVWSLSVCPRRFIL